MPRKRNIGAREGPPPEPTPPPAVPFPPIEVPAAVSLPPELLAALTAEANPYELLGREYARRAQLEGVVNAMTAYLKTLVQPKT